MSIVWTDPQIIAAIIGAIAAIAAAGIALIRLRARSKDDPTPSGTRVAKSGDRTINISTSGANSPGYVEGDYVHQTIDTRSLVDQVSEALGGQFAETKLAVDSLRSDLEAAIQTLRDHSEAPPRNEVFLKALDEMGHGRMDAAIEALDLIREEERKKGEWHTAQAASAARQIGALNYFRDTSAAIEALKEAVTLEPDSQRDWNTLGVLYMRAGAVADAEAALGEAMKLSENSDDRETMADAATNLGELYRAQNSLPTARELQTRALTINSELDRREGMAANHSNLGVIAWRSDDFARAEDHLLQALEIERALNNDAGAASDLGNLGVLYQTLGNAENSPDHLNAAKAYLEQAISIDDRLGLRTRMINHLGNLGMVLSSLADREPHAGKCAKLRREARTLVEDARGQAVELAYREAEANQWSNLGVLNEDEKDLAGAREAWMRARDIYQELKMTDEAQKMSQWIRALR